MTKLTFWIKVTKWSPINLLNVTFLNSILPFIYDGFKETNGISLPDLFWISASDLLSNNYKIFLADCLPFVRLDVNKKLQPSTHPHQIGTINETKGSTIYFN